MEIDYATRQLRRLATDRHYGGGMQPRVVDAYRGVVQALLASTDADDLRRIAWLGLELLDGPYPCERDVPVCDGYRSVLRIHERSVTILGLETCSERHWQ
jgi:hypothetical protein